jgi:hypothetical protein
VTPGYDANPAVSYFLDVTTLDIDTYKVITGEGKYKLRIFNESGEDVTGEDKKSVTHTADNTPNLTETFTGLSPGSQYTVRWYAVADTANAGNRPSIDAVAENYFAYANRTYVICESAVYTMDQNGVYVGRISASDGDLGGIRLVFAGSIGLDAVKRIQYTVTNSVDGNLTGKVDFNPAPLPGGVYSFELPPSVTDGAESTISLRFYTLDGQGNEIYINQPVSLYWYR